MHPIRLSPTLSIPMNATTPDLTTFLTMRQRLREFAEGLSEEQLFHIPSGFNNNIAWNLGHLAVTQQMLTYQLSGLPLPLDESYVKLFGKDSSPGQWTSRPDMAAFLPQLTEQAERFVADLERGLFKEFHPYMTMLKVELGTLPEAIRFNQMHEGLHLGYAMALRRAVG